MIGLAAPSGDWMPDVPSAGVTVDKCELDSVDKLMQMQFKQQSKAAKHDQKIDKPCFKSPPGEKTQSTALQNERRSERGSKKSEKAEDLIQGSKRSEIAEYFFEKKESIYASRKREPLGRAYVRGHILPDECSNESFKFGTASKTSEDAKNVLYPSGEGQFFRKHDPEAIAIDSKLRRKIDIDYDWSSTHVHPIHTRFGRPAESAPYSTGMLMQQHRSIAVGMRRRENYVFENKHEIGRAKSLRGSLRDLPAGHVFGVASSGTHWSAKDCIAGNHTVSEQQPDTTLGRSIPAKGLSLESIDTSVPAGMPSIQRNKATPEVFSVANCINYGNGTTAQQLLYPPKYSFNGVEESEFSNPRSMKDVRSIFASAGYPTADEEIDTIQNLVKANFEGKLSILTFQAAYNQMKGLC